PRPQTPGSERMRDLMIGAGLAAQRCAETLFQLGHDGPITMIGDELPYDRPPLSKAFLAGERPDVRLRPDSWYRDNDVEVGQQRAPAAAKRGMRTTLIDAQPDPFAALTGRGGGHHLQTLHARAGVELTLGRRLVAVAETLGRVRVLQLDDDSRIRPDEVVV